MPDVLSMTEIVEQDMEFLPARTTMQIITLPGGGTVSEPGTITHPPAPADLAPPYVYDPVGYPAGAAVGAVPPPADLAPVHLPEPPAEPAPAEPAPAPAPAAGSPAV
ncbi:MAG: hypothetical protein ACRDTG_13915 [Pseudonocardiaceae bacterium]